MGLMQFMRMRDFFYHAHAIIFIYFMCMHRVFLYVRYFSIKNLSK